MASAVANLLPLDTCMLYYPLTFLSVFPPLFSIPIHHGNGWAKHLRNDELTLHRLTKRIRRLKVQACVIAFGTAAVNCTIYAASACCIGFSAASFDESIMLSHTSCDGRIGNFHAPTIRACVLLMNCNICHSRVT